jgi:hypothetical protein
MKKTLWILTYQLREEFATQPGPDATREQKENYLSMIAPTHMIFETEKLLERRLFKLKDMKSEDKPIYRYKFQSVEIESYALPSML